MRREWSLNVAISRAIEAVDRPWALPVFAALMALDAFVVFVPTDGIALLVPLLRPKKWVRIFVSLAFGVALGVLVLAATVKFCYPYMVHSLFPEAMHSSAHSSVHSSVFVKSEYLVHSYGIFGLFFLSLSPIPQQLGVAVAVVLNVPIPVIFFTVFAARLLKYGFYAYLAVKIPERLMTSVWVKRQLSRFSQEHKHEHINN